MAKNPVVNESAVCPELATIRALNQSLIGNHNFKGVDDEPEEKLELKAIKIPEDELLLFRAPMSQVDMIQISELQNGVLGIFQEIFADVFSVKFMYDTQRGFLFVVSFRYMTDEQYKSKVDEAGHALIRCIISSIAPEDAAAKNSVAANIMMLVQHQQINNYDASKYAKITKEAKEMLTDMLFFSINNKKKKWVKGENFTLDTQTGTGFAGGRSFTNIIGNVFLDAEKVLSVISSKYEDASKYEYNIIPVSNNITNTDSLIKIEKVNKARKNSIRNKYGVQFSK
jgi:hypothetical protein|nr:MAG TPA: hypothetical protein [Caudoviricetes sp.]